MSEVIKLIEEGKKAAKEYAECVSLVDLGIKDGTFADREAAFLAGIKYEQDRQISDFKALRKRYDSQSLTIRQMQFEADAWKARWTNYITNTFRANGESDEEIAKYIKQREEEIEAAKKAVT